jgi:hypothetical protein
MIYTYEQLKGKIRVGDKVGKVDGEHSEHLFDSPIEMVTQSDDDGFWIADCYHAYDEDSRIDLISAEKTWATLAKGDVIQDSFGAKSIILARLEDVFFISNDATASAVRGAPYLAQELEKKGYAIVQPVDETVKEMTLADVEKLVGQKVKIVEQK